MKQKNKFRRIHTRKLDRMIAKNSLGSNLHRAIKSGQFPKIWRQLAVENK